MTHKFISLLIGLLFSFAMIVSADTHIFYSDGNKIYELPDEVTSITITNGKVELGYKTDKFSPSKQEKKVKKKDNVDEDKSDGLIEEKKRKIKGAVKSIGISFLQAALFFIFCGFACLIAMVIYMFIVRIIIGLQHKYAKRHYKDK